MRKSQKSHSINKVKVCQ